MTDRYERHTILNEIGNKGQEKLRQARVLIVGVGGLGCPAAQYLAAAGVGTLGLADDDIVSLSNLQRQILYTENDIGRYKVECAAARLKLLNSDVTIKKHISRLTSSNAYELISQYDIVIDGCDNTDTRYLISDTCALLHIPYIYGAISSFNGHVAILCQHVRAKTYRDLFPTQENRQTLPQNKGVVGTTAALIGCTQANEALKLICNYGTPLIDKLWTIDLLNMESHIILL